MFFAKVVCSVALGSQMITLVPLLAAFAAALRSARCQAGGLFMSLLKQTAALCLQWFLQSLPQTAGPRK